MYSAVCACLGGRSANDLGAGASAAMLLSAPYMPQVSKSQDHRQIQVLQQALAAQQAEAGAEVAARDARLAQLGQEAHHGQQMLRTALQQVQDQLAMQRRESEQVRSQPLGTHCLCE